MSTVAKVLVVLNVVLAAAFLGTAANYLGNQDTWKAKGEKVRKDLSAKIATKDKEIGELRTARGQLSSQLNEANTQRDKANTESAKVHAHNEQLKEAYAALAENHAIAQRAMDRMSNTIKANRELMTSYQEEITRQRGVISSVQENRDQTQQILNAKELALNRSERGNKDLQEKAEKLAEELRKSEFSNDFYRQRFPGVEAISQPPHDGRVLAADSANNTFVISLGAEDKVKPGYQYTVARGDQYVGTLVIDNVQAKKSSGRAIKDLSKSDIQAGDVVTSGR